MYGVLYVKGISTLDLLHITFEDCSCPVHVQLWCPSKQDDVLLLSRFVSSCFALFCLVLPCPPIYVLRGKKDGVVSRTVLGVFALA